MGPFKWRRNSEQTKFPIRSFPVLHEQVASRTTRPAVRRRGCFVPPGGHDQSRAAFYTETAMANDTNEGQTTNISRRSMLAAAGAAGVSVAGMAAKPALGAVPTSAVPWDGVLTTPPEAIVKTTNGPIRG